MQLFHNSHDSIYRTPFGAVPTESKIDLSIRVLSKSHPDSVKLRLWFGEEEKIIDMTLIHEGKRKSLTKTQINIDTTAKSDYIEMFYKATIKTPPYGELMWYYFIIESGGVKTYYTNNDDMCGGAGTVRTNPGEHSYQITVFDREFKTPDWFKGQIMYQIFVDRFCGDHTETGGGIPKKRDEYVIHNDWYEPISFNRHLYEDGPACNDFYGGNLKGIIKKLPYLKSLGVGVLYLNPIFDAYSNHKYDTADYKNIDPMFGTNEIFTMLCNEAEKHGIRIILDGVFSHTGSDSVYFNKYSSYGGNNGAFLDQNSEYRQWYNFSNYPEYESWWGCSNLPNVNEMNPSYLKYVLKDDDSVVKTWIDKGAKGWRLDVADELPDEFIAILRKEIKSRDKDAVIIGEVWEDASNKVAYDVPREYLFGKELDTVMNYPFKDNMISFLFGDISAEVLDKKMMSIMENYPKETVYALMNIIGTHDTMRIKSLLGGLSDDCGTKKLSSGHEELATYRLKMLSFVQMTYVGVPCIYYGDEVGMQGGRDPYNRGTYPWRAVDTELRDWYMNLGDLRNSIYCLKLGGYRTLYASDDLFVFARYIVDGKDAFGNKAKNQVAVCAINRSFEARHIDVELTGLGDFSYYEHGFLKKEVIPVKNNVIEIDVPAVGCEFFVSRTTF